MQPQGTKSEGGDQRADRQPTGRLRVKSRPARFGNVDRECHQAQLGVKMGNKADGQLDYPDWGPSGISTGGSVEQLRV